ncbi:MAG: DUF2071 domain-containing protein [Polyangiaceae bacterium]
MSHQSLPLRCPARVSSPLQLGSPSGHQWLAVSGFIPYRFLVTYRSPARALLPLLPRGLALDTHADHAFLSVCALEVRSMGIRGAPSFLRFDSLEFLYRLAVRLRGRSTFITLRSDVSSRVLAYLGRYFSHYRPRLATFAARGGGGFQRLECVSADGHGDAVLEAERVPGFRPAASVFGSAAEASDFLLGMDFSADVDAAGRVQLQDIEHSPWNASFAKLHAARFAYVERLGAALGVPLVLDHALGMRDIRQLWKAARWQ